MIIDQRWLKKHRACFDGKIWFGRTFPEGLNTENWADLAAWRNGLGEPQPSDWLSDLIYVLVENKPTFSGCRCPSSPRTRLGKELDNYLGKTVRTAHVYFWDRINVLSIERKRECLQQVARRRKMK